MIDMQAPVQPGAARPLPVGAEQDPVRASQHLFRVVLDALANPGTIRPLVVHPQVAQSGEPFSPWLASALVTLLDHEVSLHVVEGQSHAGLGPFLQRRTRVAFAEAGSAAFVVAHGASMPSDLPERARRGSLAYPDDGATLVIEVASFEPDAAGSIGLHLTGPGIEHERTLHVAGLAIEVIESRARANAGYPMGVDLLLVDGAGQVVGLPRTTQVTVAAKDVN